MRTFAEKTKVAQSATLTRSSITPQRRFGYSPEPARNLSHQHTFQPQPAQRLPQTNNEERKAGSSETAPYRFTGDWTRIPIHPRTQPSSAATAPESPTRANGVETETAVSPAPAPGVSPPTPPPPSPSPAGDSYCSVTGTLSTIPSGVIPATMSGNKLGATFNMVGDFTPRIPCSCSCGEYRQYVRGSFTVNSAPFTHYIGPGTALNPTVYQLDGNSTTANYFGRRDYRTEYSHFEHYQEGGCQFQGQDIPGISAGTGTALAMNLDFIGTLIDKCNSNSILDFAFWSVRGSGTVP